jgi:hypothetical protein
MAHTLSSAAGCPDVVGDMVFDKLARGDPEC